jgi:polar amino acid transport system permease protein
VAPGSHTSATPAPRSAIVLVGALACVLLVAACGAQGKAPFKFDGSAFWAAIVQPDGLIFAGLGLTVTISIVAQIIGVILGVFGALGRLSRSRFPRWLAGFYLWVFRGTPLLVQLTFFYFGLGAVHLYDWNPITFAGLTIPGAIQAGIFALGLNEGAYMTEIIRAGIQSIDPGQMEAAKSLGMTYGQAMRRIVLPQAARVIVPPLGNEFNNMLKTTSLLFVIGVQELYTTFEIKQGQNFLPFEMYAACAIWFLLLTTIWGYVQGRIERRLERGAPGAPMDRGPGLTARLIGLRNAGANQVAPRI